MNNEEKIIQKKKENKFGFEPKYLSLSAAIFRYNLSKPTLYALLEEGKITAKKVGRNIKFSDASLQSYYDTLPSA